MSAKPQAQRSSAWAFMERFEIPSFDDPDTLYLTRWRIIQTPWASLYLHRMDSPDSRPTLHDHPWPFVSFVLLGGYIERRLNLHTREIEERSIRRINVMRRDDAHWIDALHRTPTWTFLFVGKRRRTWGYLRRVTHGPSYDAWPDDRGSWSWTPFDRDEHAEEFDRAMAARRPVSPPSEPTPAPKEPT